MVKGISSAPDVVWVEVTDIKFQCKCIMVAITRNRSIGRPAHSPDALPAVARRKAVASGHVKNCIQRCALAIPPDPRVLDFGGHQRLRRSFLWVLVLSFFAKPPGILAKPLTRFSSKVRAMADMAPGQNLEFEAAEATEIKTLQVEIRTAHAPDRRRPCAHCRARRNTCTASFRKDSRS